MADPAGPRLSLVTLVVDDYDRAIDYYCNCLGFHLAEDTALSGKKRWVVVRPDPAAETGFLLAKADGLAQEAVIGRQTGGRVGFFLTVSDFAAAYHRLLSRGVSFEEKPRHEPYGTVAVFSDLYGNRFDLIGPPTPRKA